MIRKSLYILVAVGTVAALAWYLWVQRAELASIALVSRPALGLCACAALGSMLIAGQLFFVMINKLHRGVGLLECLSLSILTTAVNMVVPLQGGAGVRAVYLKQRHGLNYCDFLATLYGYQVLRVLLCAVCGAAAVLVIAREELSVGLMPIGVGVLLCLALALAACCLPRVPATGHWLVDRIATFTQGWHSLRAQPRDLAIMVALVGLQLAAEAVAFWAGCAAIGVNLRAPEAMAVTALSILITIVGLTPGGLGLFEAMAAFVSSAAGLNPVHSVMAALVTRLVMAAVLLLVTPVAGFQLWHSGCDALPTMEPGK